MDSKIKTEWDLSPLFASDDDPKIEEEKKAVEIESGKFVEKWKNRTDFLEDPKVLREALDEYEKWVRFHGVYGNVGFYFGLRNALNETDPEIKGKLQKIEDFGNKIANEMRFFTLKLGKVSVEKQKEFLESEELLKCRHFLKRLFVEAKYQLSESEEKILSLKAGSSKNAWVRMVSSLIAKEERELVDDEGKKKLMPFSEILTLSAFGKKAKVRDAAADAMYEILQKHSEVAEAEMNAIVNDKKVDDELRKMERPDLGRHLSDDIDSDVVDALVESVSAGNEIAHRFYSLKTKLLKLPKLKYHEKNLPYGKVDQKYTFEEASKLVGKVFSGLDPEFEKIFNEFEEKGQVDFFPRKGKTGGGFCATDLMDKPTYILLNFLGSLQDVTTIAHEFGHAINSEMMRCEQNALNFGLSLSTAEVASNFMEDFVFEKLLEKAGDEQRLGIMMMKLNDDVSSIFRQVACYQFEKDLHPLIREKGYLAKDEIGNLFKKHMKNYLGESVVMDQGSENGWVYWSHMRTFFYVYSYASGLLISKSLQASVKKDPKFILKVKEFLRAGLSDSPKNIFAKMGIDISDKTFWEKGIGQVSQLLDETEKLAKKLGKI